MLLKDKTVIWLIIYGTATKSWKLRFVFAGSHYHFRYRYQSDPDFSEMNNDADLIFLALWRMMIGFSNMANLFDFDGGPYRYLDFKKWSLSIFW